MLGSGVGAKGGGGGGILHTFGKVAVASPLEPLVTGVLGGLTETVLMSSTDLRRYKRTIDVQNILVRKEYE